MWNKFKHRSDRTELLDTPGIPQELLFQNLRELDILNRHLGGHHISLQGLKQLVTNKNKTYHIVDLGCGSGDTMKHIARWARTHGYKVKLTGIDINEHAIDYLNGHCSKYPEITGFEGDYRDFLNEASAIDIVHCSLFCHHLKDQELTDLFRWLRLNSHTGFIINDLQRSPLAYYSVKVLTRLFNGSPLAINDGPISVLRGFKMDELTSLLQNAEIINYTIDRKLGFRYLVVGKNGKR